MRQKSRIGAVELHAALEEIDAFHHPGKPIAVIVEFNRDVVRQIVPLKIPHRPKVRLQADNLLQRRRVAAPIFLHLIVVGAFPQQQHGHAVQAQRGQFDRRAGRIDIAQAGFADPIFFIVAQPGELAAGRSLPGAIDRGRVPQFINRKTQHGNSQHISQLAVKTSTLIHRATSRIRRNKNPAMNAASR